MTEVRVGDIVFRVFETYDRERYKPRLIRCPFCRSPLEVPDFEKLSMWDLSNPEMDIVLDTKVVACSSCEKEVHVPVRQTPVPKLMFTKDGDPQ